MERPAGYDWPGLFLPEAQHSRAHRSQPGSVDRTTVIE